MTLDAAHLDFETKATVNLKKSGVYRYAEDPNTAPWGFKYRLGQGPFQEWRPGFPDPVDLLNHIAAGKKVTAHNAAFERRIWLLLVQRFCPHWPIIQIGQQDCTMARASAISHPQDLDTLAVALRTVNRKDKEGHSLMMKMCRPRGFAQDGTPIWWDAPDLQDRQMIYCEQDVRVECEVDQLLPPLSPYEQSVWYFDQVINDRGIPIDVEATKKCVELVEYAKKQADSEMRKITDRNVPKCSSDKQLIEWINSRGIECTTVKKGVQDDLIFMAKTHYDDKVEEAIELRRAAKKTSTAKYKAMLECVCSDGFIRGLLSYHGAATGRWAGRLVQPHNFPRIGDGVDYIIEWLHQLLVTHTVEEIYECIVTVHGPSYPLVLLSKALRSMIKAPDGMKLVGGDFSNVEGRLNAWFAGEDWKLAAFREFDAGTGPDLYKLAAAGILGKDIANVTGFERQGTGKVSELALGFQGSVPAFISMGEQYGVDVYTLVKPVVDAVSPEQWDKTARMYAAANNKCDLPEDVWTALKIIVTNWRARNSKIVSFWWELQDQAIAAVAAPGNVFHCANGKCSYYFDGRDLKCILPSGRITTYSEAALNEKWEEYVASYETYGNVTRPVYKKRLKRSVSYYGVDSETKQWGRHYLYGGLQCENVVSGTARDVMVDRMFAVEKANYPVILTVHDEILSLVPDNQFYNDRHYTEIMSEVPAFVAGAPLTAKAWEDKRYVK